MTMLGFDVETVRGAIITMQFATSHEDAVLFDVAPDTALGSFLGYLCERGTANSLNLLWAHNLEYDFGSTFSSVFDLLWRTPSRSGTLKTHLKTGLPIELTYHNTDSPFHHLRIGKTEWLLLDTSAFFKGALVKLCVDLALPVRKLVPPTYLGERRPSPAERPSFEAYALNDAKAAYALGLHIAERHREFGIGPSFSIAHMASLIFRNRFLRSGLSRSPRLVRRDLPEEVLGVRKALRKVLWVPTDGPIPFCDRNFGPEGLLESSLLAYHGGKIGLHVPAGVYDAVAEIDIVSAYPHAMHCLPPLTSGRWERVRELAIGAAAIYRVSGTVRGRCPYGLFYRIAGSPLIHSGTFDTWVTGWELEESLPEIALHRIEDGYVWVPAPGAECPFAHYVDFFFSLKTTTPKTDPRYTTYKLLMNALYGKLIQITIRTNRNDETAVGGSLFNPFWAAQITGHTRARLHRLEHDYQAFHSSTDSIMTAARDVPVGSALGDLDEQARGRWLVLRPRLHFLVGDDGHVRKTALHGFRGKSAAALLTWVLSGGGAYQTDHMVRPREAARFGKTPFQMQREWHHLRIDPATVRHVADQWKTAQTVRPIPFPAPT